MDNGNDDDLGIPQVLRRSPATVPGKTKPESEDSSMSDVDVGEDVSPSVKVPRKVRAKANGAAKPVKAAGKAAKPVKAAGKAVKAKAKAAKAPKAAKTPLDDFGFREGSIKSQAAAMYASKKGATLAEVKAKVGSVQLNLLTELMANGHKVKRTKVDGTGSRQVTRYFLS